MKCDTFKSQRTIITQPKIFPRSWTISNLLQDTVNNLIHLINPKIYQNSRRNPNLNQTMQSFHSIIVQVPKYHHYSSKS